jgi:hypothetical protein
LRRLGRKRLAVIVDHVPKLKLCEPRFEVLKELRFEVLAEYQSTTHASKRYT